MQLGETISEGTCENISVSQDTLFLADITHYWPAPSVNSEALPFTYNQYVIS